MANYTGADVIAASDVVAYQPNAFGYGIASGASEVTAWLVQTTNDVFRDLRIRWWQSYKSNVFTDITVLGSAELTKTKVNLDQFKRAGVYLFMGRFLMPSLTKFKPEAEKDQFERMADFYMSRYSSEFKSIIEDGVEYDASGDTEISSSEREPLVGYQRLQR